MPAPIFAWLLGKILRGPENIAPGTLHVYDDFGYMSPNPSRLPISTQEQEWYAEQNAFRSQ